MLWHYGKLRCYCYSYLLQCAKTIQFILHCICFWLLVIMFFDRTCVSYEPVIWHFIAVKCVRYRVSAFLLSLCPIFVKKWSSICRQVSDLYLVLFKNYTSYFFKKLYVHMYAYGIPVPVCMHWMYPFNVIVAM